MDNGRVVPAGKGMAMKEQRWYNLGGRCMAQDDCKGAARAPGSRPRGKGSEGHRMNAVSFPQSLLSHNFFLTHNSVSPTILCVYSQVSVLFHSSYSPAIAWWRVLLSPMFLCSLPECSVVSDIPHLAQDSLFSSVMVCHAQCSVAPQEREWLQCYTSDLEWKVWPWERLGERP